MRVAAPVGAMGVLLALSACGGDSASSGSGTVTTPAPTATATPSPTPAPRPIVGVSVTTVAALPTPWSMTFLPDGRLLVTERPPTPGTLANPVTPGNLRIVSSSGAVSAPVAGLPANTGVLDVKPDPRFSDNRLVYVSYVERNPTATRMGRNAGDLSVDPAGIAVVRGALSANGGELTGTQVIWRQVPKIVSNPGSGEYGGRLAFSPDGRYLFVTSGDRQELARYLFDTDNTLGKIIRLFPDGSIPPDNPFSGLAGARTEIWSLGFRNPYGLAFDLGGQLWSHDMGPSGGDELNLVQAGLNYGWPATSYGNNYDGSPIPKPVPGDGYAPSALSWTPVIAPSDMIFYSGSLFADWRGDAIISGLQSKGLVRVRVSGTTATEVQRIDLQARIRAVAQGPDGAIWVLEDQPSGRLLKLAPVF